MIGRKDCVLNSKFVKILVPLLAILLTAVTIGAEVRAETPSDTIRIGVVKSLCKNMPEGLVKVAMQPFPALLHAQTGFSYELASPTDAMILGKQIAEKDVQLGVFQGFEFAWAREKYPELRPLLIAVNEHPNRRAHLIVRADEHITGLADLKDKELAIPRYSRDHCRMFVERQCRQSGKKMCEFFSKVKTSMNVEEALDAVVDDAVQAAVVDEVAWSCYQRRKPGRSEQLKDFAQSEWFPDTVVVYRESSIPDATLRRFQDGLLHAREIPLGRQLMTLWFMTEFQRIPPDFGQLVRDIAKIYPPPSSPRKLTSLQAD
jgi:ABC-type phosphate/phosphonate transport system substrate-binding protein